MFMCGEARSRRVSVKQRESKRKLKASFLKILHAFMYDPFYEFFRFDFCIWMYIYGRLLALPAFCFKPSTELHSI